MGDPASMSFVTWAVGGLVTLILTLWVGLAKWTSSRFNSVYSALDRKEASLRKELDRKERELTNSYNLLLEKHNTYKLEASKEYASVTHLQEVEARLAGELKELSTSIKELTAAIGRLEARQ